MEIQKQIDLENVKFDSISALYRGIKPPKDRKKLSNLEIWKLPKNKKDELKLILADEKRYKEFESLKKIHDEKIRKLTLKKAVYDIYFQKKEKQIEKVSDEPIFHYDHTKQNNWLMHPIKSLKKTWWRWFEKETIILIEMQLNNGKEIEFIRPIDSDKFKIFGGTYVIDLKLSRYSLSAEMYKLKYHQSYPLPIRQEWDVEQLKSAIETGKVIECPQATNPVNLTRFLDSHIVEQIINGAALQNLMMWILIAAILALVGHFVTYYMINAKVDAVLKVLGGAKK